MFVFSSYVMLVLLGLGCWSGLYTTFNRHSMSHSVTDVIHQ